jgi:hypothetical protein
MSVSVHQTRDEHGISKLERLALQRRGDVKMWADGGNAAVVTYENGAVLDRRRRDGMHLTRADAEHATA